MPAQGATAPFGPFPGECFFFSLRFWARCVLWRLEDLLFWPLWTQTLVQTRSGLRCCILDGVGRSAVVPSFRHCHRPQSLSCVLVFHYLHFVLVCCEILLFFGGRGNEKYCAVHFPFFNRTCFFSPTVVKKIFDFRRGGEVLAALLRTTILQSWLGWAMEWNVLGRKRPNTCRSIAQKLARCL